MNKIFKVIWSKSRNCYVVASELAKGHTKASSTGDKTRRLALAAITALMLLPVGGYSYAADPVETITVNDINGNEQTVYTKDGIDKGQESLQEDIKKFSQQVQNNFISIGENIQAKNGTYVTASQTVGENLNALDTQVKANADAINEEAKKRKYSVTNLEKADAAEAAAREAADNAIKQTMTDQKTSTALHISSSGDLIVGTNEKQTVRDMEIRGQLTSGSISTGDITSSGDVSVAGKVEAEAVYDDTTKTGNYVVQTHTVGANLDALDTQVKANADAIEEEARKRKYSVTNLENADKQLQTNIDNEAAARAATDAALDSRTTALEAKTEAITYDKDSKTVMVDGKLTATEGITDGTTQDGQYVKADNYVGQNLNALDQGLQAETAAREAADTKLDDKITAETSARVAADAKLVEAVNSGLSLSDDNVLQKNTTTIDAQGNVTTSKTDANEMILNKGNDNQITLNEQGIKVGTNSSVMDANGVYTGGDTYDAAKAALKSDGSIKGANGDFTVDENGNVTSKATITGETVTDGKGASMSNGTVTGKTLTDGIATITNGNINTSGSISGGTVTSTGNISALGDIHAGGAITGASASIQGALTAGSATITGDLTAGGAIQGKSISDGTATMQNGNLTGVKNLSAETITTSGNATIGGDLTVNGKLNVDEIDLTKNGIVGDNNVTASTKVAAGEITSYQKATSTKDGSEKESAIDYDENGTSTWAKSTDADGNWNKSTLTVEGSDVTSKVVDSNKNSNLSTQTSTQSQSTLTDKDSNTNTATQSATESSSVLQDKDGKTSTFNQRVDEILNQINSSDTVFSKVDQKVDNITSEVTDGTNTTSSTQTTTDITNTATNGTISNNAKELTNTASDNITNKAENGNISNIASNGTISNEAKTISNKAAEAMTNDAKTITNTASESVTTQIGDGSAVQSVMNESGIANKATGKSITNDAATITNTGTTSVTNQVGNNKVLVDTTHVQSAFGDTIYTTWDESGITNNATDKTVATNAKDILNTATGNITNSAANGTITNTAKDLVNTATGNMTNTVGGELKTTVTGKVTEDYKSDLDTKVGGNETHYVAGSQTNTVSGDRTVNVKGTETENFNAQVTNIKTDQKTSVGGNQTNIVAGNQQNTVSGSKTETVKGSVTEKYGSQAITVDGDQSTHVGGNQSNVVAGDQTNTISGSKTETVKGAVSETYGSQSTTVNGNQTNTVKGTLTETVTGDVTEDYKANLSTTVGGNQTTTVTGDSSLTAENINNTAKNKITNKALDVETDASSSIVSKVSNEYGSNTSTQLSYQTTEEMSQADGKTASYLRGAAEEKSQLTDGDKKTTIDTIAGQTNTNITDGTNTSNSLQKADQVASSVTDGTNTTVMNQDATSLASSITDGTKANNTNNTVDKSEQLIKASDTQYSATTKTATKTEDALVNGSTLIDIVKDSTTGTVSSAVTDGTNTTGITQTAKDITNTAQNGTIANDAKDIINNAAENMTNTVGKDLTTTVGGNQTTTVTGDSSLSANNISNTATTSITNKVGDNVSTTMSTDSIVNKVGKTTITTTDGKTKLTNEDGTHVTEMDYADVMKDLGVRGNATVDGDTTLGKEGADTKLTVNSKSTFKDTVKLEKTLEVDGTSTFNDKVTVTKGGLDVNGGTTTDTLHVTSTSTFDGAATFKDAVTMEKDLSVGGNATVAGSMTASSYKVGDKTYIDSNGINANNQKIVNVASGDLSASSTDAVNGAQLYQTNERVASVENRVDTVENRVSNLDSRVDKVGANAAALANLHPLEFDADSKWNIAAAVGGYKGETATAIGAFYRPNENVMVNVSSSFGTGENMYGGGLSFRIGQGGNKARRNATNGLTEREKAMQKQIDSLTNRLDALLSVINPNMSKEFPDVPENHWAYEAVSRLAGNGIIQGYEDGKYHGERTMTRYEMAEIIYNALSKGAKAEKKLVEEFKPELQAMAAQKKA